MEKPPRPDAPNPAFELMERVHRACAALALAGRSVTNEAVRESIGGSYRDIAPHVKSYKAMQRTAPVPQEEAGLPGNVVEAVKVLQAHLQADADEKVAAAHQELTEVEARAHADLQAAAIREAALTSENAQLRLDMMNARAQVATLEAYRADQNTTIARLEADNAAQVQRLADRAAELHELKQQLERLRRQYTHLEEKSAEKLDEERRAAAQRYNVLQHEHQQLQRTSGSLEAGLRAAEAQVSQLHGDVERAMAAIEAAGAATAQARAEREHTLSALDQVQAAHSELMQRAENTERQLREVRLELAGREGELKIVARDLTRIQNLYDKLNQAQVIWRQERAALEEQLRELGTGD